MRIAFAALFAASALASVAQAQQPAPASPPAPPAPPASTAATPPAAPATPAPDAAAAPAAAPALSPTDEAKARLTAITGDGAQILQTIEKICVPLVRGGNFDQLMKANGFKQNRREQNWSIQLGTTSKDYSITMSPPGVNKDVCRGEVHYALGQDKPIIEALVVWSFLHQPELELQANYVAVDPDGVKRVRKSWEAQAPNSSTAVNFSTWTKPDDSSLNAKYSTGELFYQERKF